MKAFLVWLKSLFIKTPVAATAVTETQTSEDKTVSVLQLSILANNQIANGTSAASVQAFVTDDNAAAVGAPVIFSVNSGTVSPANGVTDATGKLVSSITSTAAGTVTLTAQLADGTTQQVNLTFVAVPSPVAQPAAQSTATPGQEAKTGVKDFDAALKFVESGVGQLGASAKDELKSLAKKYL